jgi:hypothetical protein
VNRKAMILAMLLLLIAMIGVAAILITLQSQKQPAVATTNGATGTTAVAGTTVAGQGSVVGAGAGAGGLVAQPGDTLVTLSWRAVAGASKYLIYRDGAADPLDSVPGNTTSYTDIGLSNGRTYSYTIAAADGNGRPTGSPLGPVSASPRSH